MDNHEAPLPLPSGTKIREFKLEEKLGEGSFGIVYRATHEILGETVAIKEFLPRDLARRTDGNRVEALPGKSEAYAWARDKFLHEARTLTELTDSRQPQPNLVQVKHAFAENDTVYMSMGYEAGTALDRCFPVGGPTEQELRRIVLALLDGLRYVHDRGVWHRDIKPSNILIRDDGSPVLIDFGAARQDVGKSDLSVMAQCTPGYAAPEQLWGGEKQGPWTDIYGLGATLYRVIAGAPPQGFSRTTLREEYRGRYSEGFLAAVDAALEPKPADRPQSVREWRRLFESGAPEPPRSDAPTELQPAAGSMDATRVVASRTPTVVSSGPASSSRPSVELPEATRKSHTWAWATFGIVLIAVVAGGLWQWVLFSPGHENEAELSFTAQPDGEEGASPPLTTSAAVRGIAPTATPQASPGKGASSAPAGRTGPKRETAASQGLGETAAMPVKPAVPMDLTDASRKDGETAAGRLHTEPAPASAGEHRAELAPAAKAATLAMIEGLVADFQCARIETSLSPDRVLTLGGHLGSEEDLAVLRARLRGLEHVERLQDDAVKIYGWPFCQVIATLDDAVEGADAGTREPSILLNKPRPLYREGEYLVVTCMNNNPRNGYVYLDYVDVAGDVAHLLPTSTDPDNAVDGWGQVVVGSEDKKACLRRQCFEVSPPHGRNLVVALWSRAPIFSGPRRQLVEPAADYFASLAGVLRDARIGGIDDIAVSYRFLDTQE